MTEKKLIENARKRWREFQSLSPEEQARRLIAWGVIDEKGDVLFGTETDEKQNGMGPLPKQ